MSNFTFIHTADLHLDSPLRGLERYEGAPVTEIRNATRRAFMNLVDLAIAQQVDFVVIAGDVFDGDWKDYNTGLFFTKQMSRLREAEIPVFMLAGNHDAAGVLSRDLSFPKNVQRFSAKQPETFKLEELRVALHGQSFPSAAVTENLSRAYPEAVPGYFNIGVLHTSTTGREGHANYAPCSIPDLTAKSYDYWALGHVHTREILHENPWIVFPGNIQGRHIREQGAKGCTLISVADRRIKTVEPCEIDVLRWTEIEIPCAEAENLDEVIQQLLENLRDRAAEEGGRTLAVRLLLTGASPAHAQLTDNREHAMAQIRSAAIDHFGSEIWIEKIVFKTIPSVDLANLSEGDTAAADFLRLIDETVSNEEDLAALAAEFDPIRRRLSPHLSQSNQDGYELDSQWICDRLQEVKQELLPRLLSRPE